MNLIGVIRNVFTSCYRSTLNTHIDEPSELGIHPVFSLGVLPKMTFDTAVYHCPKLATYNKRNIDRVWEVEDNSVYVSARVGDEIICT